MMELFHLDGCGIWKGKTLEAILVEKKVSGVSSYFFLSLFLSFFVRRRIGNNGPKGTKPEKDLFSDERVFFASLSLSHRRRE